MADPSIQGVLASIASYGYPLLLLAATAEATFVVGLLVPGDLVVALGGVSAARGILDLPAVYGIVSIGTILGSQLSYWIGKLGGEALIVRWGARFEIRAQRIESVREFFRQQGTKAVFLSVFVAGMKNLVPAMAGAIGMTPLRFGSSNALGTVLRSALVVGIGYILGANLDRAISMIGSLNGWAAVVLGCVAVGFLVKRVRARARKG